MRTLNNGRALWLVSGVLCTSMLTACGGDSDSKSNSGTGGPTFPDGAIMLSGDNLTQSAKEAFINAKSGDVIVFPEGRFELTDTLTLDGDSDGNGISTEGITILGYGKGKTILDFTASAGGDGIFVQNAVDITIKDLAVYEAPNNAIKLINTDGIILDSVATVWEGVLDQNNGAYGLYPVQCSNILIQNSYVRGSADAGVYVGQSSNIVVRRNTAIENVAGIEIENSTNADVYDNVATGNTGGVLVFDLPIGQGFYGSNVRVFDNQITANNTDNFANSSDFAAGVHIVPPGTGVIVLSTGDVEIYENAISNHDTMSVAITSYLLPDPALGDPTSDASVNTYQPVIEDGWQPVPRNVQVHDNAVSASGGSPRGNLIEDLINGYMLDPTKGEMPAILYDGAGELMTNAGDTRFGQPFGEGDHICASDNGSASYGQVTDTVPDGTNIDPVTGPVNKLYLETTQTNLLTCATTPTRLTASKATIADKAYGCGSSESGDASAASCAL